MKTMSYFSVSRAKCEMLTNYNFSNGFKNKITVQLTSERSELYFKVNIMVIEKRQLTIFIILVDTNWVLFTWDESKVPSVSWTSTSTSFIWKSSALFFFNLTFSDHQISERPPLKCSKAGKKYTSIIEI